MTLMLPPIKAATVHSMDSSTTPDTAAEWHGAVAQWCNDESGVTAIEYGLLAALIAVACVGAFSLAGTSIVGMYTEWSSAVVAAL